MRRQAVNNTIEDKILTGMIISTKFCRDINRLYKKEYLLTSYAQIIARWCLDYYRKYREAPIKKIQDIYHLEKSKLKEADTEIISAFLSKLSDQLEQEESFNAEYIFDKAKEYFKKRSLSITVTNVQSLLELNKINSAEKEIQKYRELAAESSGWINPLLEQEVKKYFQDEQDKSHVLFQMPDQVGKMIGSFERGWLFSVFGPVKRGKSFWLQEIAIQAILENQKTLFISLEMGTHRVKRRIYKRLTAFGEKDEGNTFIYPCFDCVKNQNNTCEKNQRDNKISLLNELGEKPGYDDKMAYRPCIKCRGTKDFEVTNWFTSIERDKMKIRNTSKKIRGIQRLIGDNFRLQSYPAFSANLSQILGDIEELEYIENFIPDVIVIDYPDILAPEDSHVIGRERIDETWKTLKNIAETRHCLVVVASQTNRGSFDKKNVVQTDAAEDIRKLAHVDAAIALNQLPGEKREKIIRVALIAERDGDYDQYQSCLVLQQLELGQINLDSELMSPFLEDNKKSSKHISRKK